MKRLVKFLKKERKFEKKHRLIALLVVLILVLIVASYFFLPFKTTDTINDQKVKLDVSEFQTPKVGLGGKAVFDVMIAQTEKQKTLGLSVFDSIEDYQGMLFYFMQKDYHRFWMKDMKFDIDIVWIDDNKIVDIDKNLSSQKDKQLNIVSPLEKINFVLEINAGLVDKYGIKVGDRVDFHNIIFVDKETGERL